MRFLIPFLLLASSAAAQQAPDPAYADLERAYQALRAKDYDTAIAGFRRGTVVAPDSVQIHKDLGYTLLKIGETEAARDQFAIAMKLDPADENLALEYAYLCYETKRPVDARRTFYRFRLTNAGAAQAFENIDRPLREGIARWQEAAKQDPNNFSAHEELARLAEQRDELPLAAEHFERAWNLKPLRRDLLVDLGRVWQQVSREGDAMAALLAASRGAEPRIAEQARELLPERYPYVYEFEKALAVDASNIDLRREFAYLLLAMNRLAEAEKQFEMILSRADGDLLSTAQLGLLMLARGDGKAAQPLFEKVLSSKDEALADRVRKALGMPQTLQGRPEAPRASVSVEAKTLGLSSLEKGFLKDALKYLSIAHENDPVDFDVMLKLGWANNVLKNDSDALKWFNLARRSPDAKTSAEALRAYHNLKPSQQRFRTTVWAFPTFSTRWRDLFAYAQSKTEWQLKRLPLRPYFSVRFVGDARQTPIRFGSGFAPQYLSEGAATVGLGISTHAWRGINGWFEAGEQLRYRVTATDPARMLPDYRGGASYAKGFGHLLTSGSHGSFLETNDDLIYVHRFGKDTLGYTQNRFGYTGREAENFGGLHWQVYWNAGVTADLKRQYWANFVETGPGLRFRFEHMPSFLFSVNAMRGVYLINQDNPRRPNFMDLRVGVWYAITR